MGWLQFVKLVTAFFFFNFFLFLLIMDITLEIVAGNQVTKICLRAYMMNLGCHYDRSQPWRNSTS